MPETIQHYLPLTEATFYVLLSMAVERKHGYAILKDVEALSQGQIVLSTGTLYGALSRMQDQGLIEPVEAEDPEETGRPRKFYLPTRLGRDVLEAETRRLQALVGIARQRLAQSGAARS